MQRRTLGSSGLEISTIGLGTWAVGGHMWGGQDDKESAGAIHAAVDHGINWIDTAPIYGSGHSEEVVGRAVKALPPGRRPLVFTKFGLGIDSNNPNRSASAADVDRGVRGQPAPARRRTDRPLPASLAGAAADRGNCRRLRRPARGRKGCRDRRLELFGRPARGVACDRRAAPLRSASLQHPPAGGEARRAAVVRREQRRRNLLFAALPRHALRHLGTRQDVSERRRPGRHKDYLGPRFQRHLQAVDEIRAVATRGGLSVAQLCVGVLLHTPGLTGVIVGARNARQGGMVPSLGVGISAEQADAVWSIAGRLARDLEAI